jgi:hypothetical protein
MDDATMMIYDLIKREILKILLCKTHKDCDLKNYDENKNQLKINKCLSIPFSAPFPTTYFLKKTPSRAVRPLKFNSLFFFQYFDKKLFKIIN